MTPAPGWYGRAARAERTPQATIDNNGLYESIDYTLVAAGDLTGPHPTQSAAIASLRTSPTPHPYTPTSLIYGPCRNTTHPLGHRARTAFTVTETYAVGIPGCKATFTPPNSDEPSESCFLPEHHIGAHDNGSIEEDGDLLFWIDDQGVGTPLQVQDSHLVLVPASLLETFVLTFSEGDLADELAARLTCSEVDALASLLFALGCEDSARTWLVSHSADDDEGDRHFLERLYHHTT
ncbi:hypothetical protein [Nocardiopsis synnemataformans]|uniref:hypothetical protein n=1 Tax=Nocardiopsis synnemataformans TaxID=61305 RepID=UPI003EB80250